MTNPNPTFELSYDIHSLESQVEGLLNDLHELLYNKSERQPIVDQHKSNLTTKYNYLYTKIPKLFDLALEYYVEKKSIREFREIFSHFMIQVRKLQENPDNYKKSSEHIGKYMGDKYLPKE